VTDWLRSQNWGQPGGARGYPARMFVLAVSGVLIIGTTVLGALVLLAILLRNEDRYQAEQRRRQDRRDEHS
jgi:hypothetical protein